MDEPQDKPRTSAVDWFVASVFSASVEIDDAKAKLLEDCAAAFLRSNGTLSWDQWQSLSPESRVAFGVAGMKVRQEDLSVLLEALVNEGDGHADG